MGYYFEKARSRKDLSPEQLERYNAFRSPDSTLPIPQELHDRIEFIKEYVGLVTSGEVWSAFEELVQDAFVAWIIAGEDPQKVQWIHPDNLATPPPPPPTEEEERERQEWLDSLHREPELPQRKTLFGRLVSLLRRET